MTTPSNTPALPAVEAAGDGTNSYIWAVLAVAVATQTAGSVVAQGVYILVPFWRDTFGVSLASASLAVTVMNGAQIATMFAFGRAIDRHGERTVVGLAMLGMGLAMAGAAALVQGLPALLLCMAALGGTYAAVQPGGTRAIMRWFPPQHRGLATGFRQAAVPFGTMIAAILFPFLAVNHGWAAAAWAAAATSIAGGALFWSLYREGGTVAAKAEQPLPLGILVRTLGEDRTFWPVLRLGIAMSAFQFTFTAHAIGFIADGLGLGLLTAASLFAGAQVAGIPGRVLLPWASDRFLPGRRVWSFGAVSLLGTAAAAALAALPASTPGPLVAAVLVVFGVFGIGWFPIYLLQVAETAPKGSIASTVSFATTLCMVVMALGPFLFGFVVDHAGYTPAWALLIAPVVVTALPLLRTGPRTGA